MPLKFCANLSFMFQESSSLLERYTLAKRYGFKAVECAFPYVHPVQEVAVAKIESGLEQILINVPQGDTSIGDLGCAALPERTAEFRKHIDISLEYAKALSCKRVHIMSGKVCHPTKDHMATYESNLRYAVDCFQKEDIVALIEPINNITVPNYFMNSYKYALEVVSKINSPNLRIMMDLFHLQILNGNLTNMIREYLPYVGHIQISQVPNRNEPGTPGEINFRYIFSLLENLEYDGWIGLEYKPLQSTTEGLQWLQRYGINL